MKIATIDASDGLMPGFCDPVRDSQRSFRTILDAMSHPGKICGLEMDLTPPAPLTVACAALCLTLADRETPLWLDSAAANGTVASYLKFHCGVPISSSPEKAWFAVIADGATLPPLDSFDSGDDEFPENSTTLLVQIGTFGAGRDWRLRGPGIERTTRLSVGGLASSFITDWQRNHQSFPRGVDVILIAGCQIAALPRTTEIED